MAQQIFDRSGHSRLVIPRTEYDPLHAGKDDTPGAHGARLQRHVERAIVQTPALELGRCLAYREQLRVSGRVLITNGSIARGGYYGSVANNHGPNGDLVSLHRFTCDIEGVADVLLVRGK